jgi:hypothetical protein
VPGLVRMALDVGEVLQGYVEDVMENYDVVMAGGE